MLTTSEVNIRCRFDELNKTRCLCNMETIRTNRALGPVQEKRIHALVIWSME